MTEGVRVSTCRSCGAPVLWVRTPSGKAMPLDAEPSQDGHIRIGAIGGEDVALVLIDGELEAARIAGPLYASHFATCPDADKWRRPR